MKVKNLQLGTTITYRVSSQIRASLNPAGIGTSPDQQTFAIRARAEYRLHLIVLSRKPEEGTWCLVRWSDWKLTSTPELPDWKEQTQQVGDWYLLFTPNGTLYLPHAGPNDEKLHHPRANAVWMLQFVLPNSKPLPKRWQIQEPYLSCKALCTYQHKGQKGNQTVFQKRYERAILTEAERSVGKEIRLEGTLSYEQISPMLWKRLEGKIREQSLFQSKPVGSNETTLSVQLEKVTAPSAGTLRMARTFRPPQGNRVPLYGLVATNVDQEKARAKALLGNRSLSQLWKELDALGESPEDRSEKATQKYTELALALEGARILYPDRVIPRLKKILAEAAVNSARFWLVLGALGNDCVPMLTEIYQHSPAAEKRLILLRQMSFCVPNSTQLFETLHAHLPHITNNDEYRQAILTLAAWIPHFREAPTESMRQFVRWVREQTESALANPSMTEQTFWLSVLRNLKDEQQIDLIDRFAQRGEDTVRQEAVNILLEILPKSNLRFAEKLYERDPSPRVRLAVVTKVIDSIPHPDAYKLVDRALFNDPDQRVRLELLKPLAEKAMSDSVVLKLLVRASKTNSMDEVRRQSLVILAALHAQGVPIPDE